ncbi:hypothetical protein K458DRAFT_436096 [Lentithecium fluviatile CBS 122367]|uniref:Uncharacterized protein n=1 Tax=Lentithecium fluviatile CBS 122367 TaxID=1168545 RepID=A0A6G1IIX7_9PLEO|nr:hypothetical protein K458DRAFT_436096 [Lentithecium fluviatile CBS 122367]
MKDLGRARDCQLFSAVQDGETLLDVLRVLLDYPPTCLILQSYRPADAVHSQRGIVYCEVVPSMSTFRAIGEIQEPFCSTTASARLNLEEWTDVRSTETHPHASLLEEQRLGLGRGSGWIFPGARFVSAHVEANRDEMISFPLPVYQTQPHASSQEAGTANLEISSTSLGSSAAMHDPLPTAYPPAIQQHPGRVSHATKVPPTDPATCSTGRGNAGGEPLSMLAPE